MAQIETAIMLNGTPFHDQNIQNTWLATIKTPLHGEITAFVKLIDERKLMVECICAVLGRKLGLPIPEPFLVLVPHTVLSEKTSISTGAQIAFGSMDAGYPSLRKFIKIDSEESVKLFLDKLMDYDYTFPIGGFDEWIVNDDRKIGNILFDGRESFVFIDHERALPEDYPAKQIAPQNIILTLLKEHKKSIETLKIQKFISVCNEVPTTLLTDHIPPLKNHPTLIEMAMFITDRIDYLEQLVTKRLAA